ncbi:hypothetical protein Tco_1419007 [Tanacetum coccineum]
MLRFARWSMSEYMTLRFHVSTSKEKILDREIKSLKRSKISLVKVRWDSKRGPEFTWEREDFMKSKYPSVDCLARRQ